MTRYMCKHCGRNVGFWFYGWKHQTGGPVRKATCGRKLTAADVEVRP